MTPPARPPHVYGVRKIKMSGTFIIISCIRAGSLKRTLGYGAENTSERATSPSIISFRSSTIGSV